MAHGNFSDFAAIFFIAGAIQHMFFPEYCFQVPEQLESVGMMPFFDSGRTLTVDYCLRILGAFLLLLGFILSTVRWNNINGKLTSIGFLIVACIGAKSTFDMDGKFVLRPQYVISGMSVLTALHLFGRPAHPCKKCKTA